jgi:hypothetical protein
MSELETELQSAFEDGAYVVEDVSNNRGQVRVVIRDGDAEAEALRGIVDGVVDESDRMGLKVSTESVEGLDDVSTVVTFRYRG